MATSPQYVGTAKSASVAISTANASMDGVTGAYGTLFTAGASGSRIDAIRVQAVGTTLSGLVRLFVGTALILEIPVTAVTASTTSVAFGVSVEFDVPLVLSALAVLKCSTSVTNSVVLTVTNGGDF